MISQDRLEKAMTFLAESDQPFADARMAMERAKYKADAVHNTIFLHETGTVAERSARAGISEEYDKAMGVYFEALREYDYVKHKRSTEELIVDVFRTLEASRRKS